MLTQQELKKHLHYDPVTGYWYWLTPHLYSKRAGVLTTKGYLRIQLLKRNYYGHRLAFLYMTGNTPEVVDHINITPGDDRWCNLRASTPRNNNLNRKVKPASGYHNIYLCNNKWRVQIQGLPQRSFHHLEAAIQHRDKLLDEVL